MGNMVKRERNTYINSFPDFICVASAIGCKHDSSWLWNCRKQHNYTVEKTHVNIQNSDQTNLVKWSTHLGKINLEQLTSLIFYDALWCLPYSFQPRPYILFFFGPESQSIHSFPILWRLHIQVIRWLIQQQDIRWARHRSSQEQTDPPTFRDASTKRSWELLALVVSTHLNIYSPNWIISPSRGGKKIETTTA